MGLGNSYMRVKFSTATNVSLQRYLYSVKT